MNERQNYVVIERPLANGGYEIEYHIEESLWDEYIEVTGQTDAGYFEEWLSESGH